MRARCVLRVLPGRATTVRPDLSILSAVSPAAELLRAATGLEPTGAGAVCFAAAEDGATRPDPLGTVDRDAATDVLVRTDEFGFTWVTCRRSDADLPRLLMQLCRVNGVLVDAGLGPCLRYTSIGFASPADSRRLALVYLPDRGTFYPFAPHRVPLRDNALELRVRDEIGDVLPIEPDISRWFPTWNAPVP